MKNAFSAPALTLISAGLLLAGQLHAAETMGAQTSSGQRIDQQNSTQSTGAIGAGPPVVNPGDDGGYQSDSTIHRTGGDERTNPDGSEFETDLDGTSNTTFPGD